MKEQPDFSALMSDIEPMVSRIKQTGGIVQIEAKLDGHFTIISVVPSYPRRYRIRRDPELPPQQ